MDWYDLNARDVTATYDALRPEAVHQSWCHLLDDINPGLVCDVGAGSGRDARWLAGRGWDVVAVEPSRAMLALASGGASAAVSDHSVSWLRDELPDLTALRTVGYRFDLILVSAVWQHIADSARCRAFRVLSELLKPGGRLVITLRHGKNFPENEDRGFLPVCGDSLVKYADERALVTEIRVMVPDVGRQDIEWETLVFRLPDNASVGTEGVRCIGEQDV